MEIIGVDGCPGGWLAVSYDVEAGTLTPRVHPYFAALLAAYPNASCVAVDIPIGLAEGEPRRCDRAARRVLGKPKASSVFPAPDPRVLTAATYEQASERSYALIGRKVTKQGFAIFPKILEVNWALTPALQGRVFEVHPEVCFWALAGGRPMEHAKRTKEGFEERRALLAEAFGPAVPKRDDAGRWARPASPDDVLDAIVAAWTARRAAQGKAGRLPPEPAVDARGLRMEMIY